MKKTFAIFIVVLIVCVQPALAEVTGSGSISFTFGGALPDLAQFFPNASVADSPGSTTYGTTSVNNGNSSASVTLGGPTYYYPVSSLNTTSFNFIANKPSAGVYGNAQVDIGGYFLFGGAVNGFGYGNNITTLPAFSYSYNFNGLADTTDDQMVFRVQFALSNDINGDNSHPATILYSDYDPATPGFRTKMPEFIVPGLGPQISANGTVDFGPFTENVPHTWYLRWDLEGFITDYAQGQVIGAVPEPATMLLFGLGLAGLAGVRRFK